VIKVVKMNPRFRRKYRTQQERAAALNQKWRKEACVIESLHREMRKVSVQNGLQFISLEHRPFKNLTVDKVS
jgi:hypothetical protein